ncbi:MAG: hypothetical protein KDC44_23035 [Phaeodactylibacter sp.]|nr:hypothetical protein [Phaeodactylibacter sp.]
MLHPSLTYFYGYWQLAACLFASAALLAIWWHIGRKQGDFGQVWLALSVLCWSVSGGVEVYFAERALAIPPRSLNIQLEGWRSILSLFNSLFILLALPWFRYIPQAIEPLIKSKYWNLIVGLPFVFSLLPTVSRMFTASNYVVIGELDVYYAFLTLLFLGYVLWASFEKRRLPLLAWLSVVCILITFIAQLYKLSDSPVNMVLFSAIFKTSLIMLFFALALSWVKELAENIIPEAAQIFLKMERRKAHQKFEYWITLHGFPGKQQRQIQLTPALYTLLHTFALRRQSPEEDWLEIRPKNDTRPAKTYDINDHNEIRRLLTALLDGLFGKGNWSKNQHWEPLRSTLFELSDKRERKIRLRLPPQNIQVHQGH